MNTKTGHCVRLQKPLGEHHTERSGMVTSVRSPAIERLPHWRAEWGHEVREKIGQVDSVSIGAAPGRDISFTRLE